MKFVIILSNCNTCLHSDKKVIPTLLSRRRFVLIKQKKDSNRTTSPTPLEKQLLSKRFPSYASRVIPGYANNRNVVDTHQQRMKESRNIPAPSWRYRHFWVHSYVQSKVGANCHFCMLIKASRTHARCVDISWLCWSIYRTIDLNTQEDWSRYNLLNWSTYNSQCQSYL